jgi:2-keto-4-pentenoate hydratase/2-oxohepta-3-ene-1,7-dioic acid hydratase in catechol pathway
MDQAGSVQWGRLLEGGLADPMTGDLFGAYRWSDRPTTIVRRRSPIAPPNVVAIGRNYAEHAREMKSESLPAEPLIFLKATTSVIGPDDAIVLPRSAPSEVDYEAELAVVIGKSAKEVRDKDALDYVLGYTCANDVSARDCQQRRDKQWARGKSFDTFCPLGPVLVTADELDVSRLTIRSILNGRVMQEASTADMIFSVPQLVSYLSCQFTLLPGTVILTGTPPGVGAARTPPVFLKSGDDITVEIEGIGQLSNSVINAD